MTHLILRVRVRWLLAVVNWCRSKYNTPILQLPLLSTVLIGDARALTRCEFGTLLRRRCCDRSGV